MLVVEGMHTYYGQSHVLHGVSLQVGAGEVVSLLGRNGAGKTTTISSIMGLQPPRLGRVLYHGDNIAHRPPHAIFRLGIKLVPQGRRIIPMLTVEENLKLALLNTTIRCHRRQELERVYGRFPVLRAKRQQKGGHLSGGERQMLAIARALLGTTRLILLDEPTEGLAPVVVQEVMQLVRDIQEDGVAVLLAEQNVKMAFEIADRHYVLDRGVVRFAGNTSHLQANLDLLASYLGVTVTS
jgi:branched-chain amino acid transport system ATP-binding protein